MAALASAWCIGRKRDGRCVYDEQAKAELVMACGKPGASVSRLARECGVNANQLSRWIREHGQRKERMSDESSTTALSFVPVHIEPAMPVPFEATLNVQARLPNGVVVDLSGCDLSQASQLIEALGKLRCFASTKA